MQEVIDLFRNRLPTYGYATNDLTYGVRFLPREDAIEKSIIQPNWRHSIGWLPYDIDSESARFDWGDSSCPPPNLLILNPENGHGHLLYGLKAPVHAYPHARDKPLRYLAAIDRAMTIELNADPGYAKLLAKNPLNPKWETLVPRVELYDLEELASWVDLEKLKDYSKEQPETGYSRNITMFDRLRAWAYSARRRYYSHEGQAFRDATREHALTINVEFEQPLPHAEVRAIARSVLKWVEKNMSDQGFVAHQRELGRLSGVARREKAMKLQKSIVEIAKQSPALTQVGIGDLLGVNQATVSRHLRDYARTISDKYLFKPEGGAE